MNKNEDQFFQEVQSVFSDHAPQVPEHIYAGIRKKMKKKRVLFLGWSLNNWLLLLGIAGAGAAVWSISGDENSAYQAGSPEFNEANTHLIDKAHRSIQDDEGTAQYEEIIIDQSPAAEPNIVATSIRHSSKANNIDAGNNIAQENDKEEVLATAIDASEESNTQSTENAVPTESLSSAPDCNPKSELKDELGPESDASQKISATFVLTEYKTVEMEKEKEKKKK